jgi:hypothetical protein
MPKTTQLENNGQDWNNAAEMLPHTDEFMQGDRYASIRARRENGEVLLRFDKSKKLVWRKPEHFKEYHR